MIRDAIHNLPIPGYTRERHTEYTDYCPYRAESFQAACNESLRANMRFAAWMRRKEQERANRTPEDNLSFMAWFAQNGHLIPEG